MMHWDFQRPDTTLHFQNPAASQFMAKGPTVMTFLKFQKFSWHRVDLLMETQSDHIKDCKIYIYSYCCAITSRKEIEVTILYRDLAHSARAVRLDSS